MRPYHRPPLDYVTRARTKSTVEKGGGRRVNRAAFLAAFTPHSVLLVPVGHGHGHGPRAAGRGTPVNFLGGTGATGHQGPQKVKAKGGKYALMPPLSCEGLESTLHLNKGYRVWARIDGKSAKASPGHEEN